MDFGMPTLIELKSLEENAALCRELGLAFIEINMNMPEYQIDRLDRVRLAKTAEKYGIYFTIHLDENCNPSDFNERVATVYTETVIETIEVAKTLNIPVLNMHLSTGVYFTLPDKKIYLFEEYREEYLTRLKAFRNTCATAIGDADIRICVENCGDYARAVFLKKGLDVLLESPAFGLTFDIGHNAAAGYGEESTILERADRLLHFHVHDAKGTSHHLALGDGDMDLPQYLQLAKAHHCRAVLETKTVDALRRSVVWLKEKGFR